MDLIKLLLLAINFGVFAAQTSPSASPALLIPVGHLEEYIKAEVTRQVREMSKDVINQAVEEKIRDVNKEVIEKEVNKQIQKHVITESVDFIKLESQISSLEAKYVRMHQRLEALEKHQIWQKYFNNGILDLVDTCKNKHEIKLSSLETKYVRIYQRLEDVENCEICAELINREGNITQRQEMIENITRKVDKASILTIQEINKIENISEEIKKDIKEYQNLTDRRLDNLENQTRNYDALADQRINSIENKTNIYNAVTTRRLNDLENKARVYDAAMDRRLDDLENQTRIYDAITDRRIDALENKTSVYANVISNMTNGSYQTGKCPPLLPVKYHGHCYGLFRYSLTYRQAQSHCRVFSANLVWIENRSEQHFVKSTFSPQIIDIWIGCNDIAREGRFVWGHNNQPITYSNWKYGEPNNHDNREDCCMMGYKGAGLWNDILCSYPLPTFICKK